MTKVESLDALKQMRERLRSDMNIRENSNHPEDLPQIRISMGTCGIAAGAKEVMSRFISELRARNVDAVVTQTDCMGPLRSGTDRGNHPAGQGTRPVRRRHSRPRGGNHRQVHPQRQPAEGIIATGPSTAV